MIALSPSDTVRRYLAFRVIVNAMSFEDLVRNRQHLRFRRIRDVLLAHKQEPNFFEGYRAADDIRDVSIKPLLAMMSVDTDTIRAADGLPELADATIATGFDNVAATVLRKYHDEEIAGFRVTNNFLCFEGSHVHDISNSGLAGCFFRYVSSRALFDLASFLTNNLRLEPKFRGSYRHAKLDLILHAVNMADCALKDFHNNHSIDGLREVMVGEPIGDASALDALAADARFQDLYGRMRRIRNKLIGHMDRAVPLQQLLTKLDTLPEDDIYEMIKAGLSGLLPSDCPLCLLPSSNSATIIG